MKNTNAIQLYNNLCTREVGSAEGEEVSMTTNFGIAMTAMDCPLFIPYNIHLRKIQEPGKDWSAEQIKGLQEANQRAVINNEKAKVKFRDVAEALHAWADSIEEITHADTR